MMRVAMVAGPIAYTAALTSALSRYCAIDLYCGKRYAGTEDPAIFRSLPPNVKVILYDEFRKRDPRNVLAQFRLSRMLRKGRYDLIHLQYEWEWSQMLFRPLLRKTPLVFTVHDPYQHVGYSPFLVAYMDILQAFFVKRAARLVVHGETMKASLLRRYKYLDPGIVLSHLHGDPSLDAIAGKPAAEAPAGAPDGNIVLFFGNIRPNKGLPWLVKAEPLIAATVKDFKIHIVGRCADASYKKHISNPGRFIITEEFVPHDAVAGIFRSASVVVLPYISATQTGVIPLAYGFGIPVVATAVGGLVDVVENGKTGFLVEPRNERALAEAISKILLDRDLQLRMGRAAREFAETRLSWDAAAKITMEAYKEVCACRKKPNQEQLTSPD